MGPFEHWPTMQGFEKFYGFIGGETNQWFPEVFDNLTRVEVPNDPSYHFTEDMADKAIDWIKAQKAIYPDKPFFIYWAPGATHAPHQVPAEWIEKYKGKFDDGWDKLRERTFARQKELGVIPADAELTPRPDAIPAWDDMPEELKPLLRRQMETYAGFLEHTDHQVGRLVDLLEQAEILDDTLIYYIIGDNGASAEGTLNGTFNEMINFNGVPELETPEFLHGAPGRLGWPRLLSPLRRRLGARHGHPLPVDQAGRLPLGRHPQRHHRPLAGGHHGQRRGAPPVPPRHRRRADHPGSRRVCRSRPSSKGCSSSRWKARACSTASMTAGAKDQHTIQYFEMFGNRGIYYDGWTAVTRHSIPWELTAKSTPFNDDVWELYDTNTDWTQAHDLAAEMPEKLAELQRQWLIEATRYNVLPLDDRRAERMIPATAGRPTLIKGDTQVLFPGMAMGENNVVDIKNKSYAVTANVTFPEKDAEGVIIAQGANFGGWAIYAHEGQAEVHLQLPRARDVRGRNRGDVAVRATIRCGWSSPTTAAGWARAGQRRSTSTASRSARGGSSTPTPPSSPPMRRRWSATSSARRSVPIWRSRATRSTARSRACRSTSSSTTRTT